MAPRSAVVMAKETNQLPQNGKKGNHGYHTLLEPKALPFPFSLRLPFSGKAAFVVNFFTARLFGQPPDKRLSVSLTRFLLGNRKASGTMQEIFSRKDMCSPSPC
jgi:hypothetical protein